MSNHTSSFRRYRAVVAPLAVAAVLSTAVAGGAQAASRHPSPSPARTLGALADQVVAAGAPGVLVRVDSGRDAAPIEVTRQASWARSDGSLDADDPVRMGSNTKTMVATLVLQLVAEHKLALGDSVESRLPGMVPNGSAITIRMLLDHTSGLYNYLDDPAVLASFIGQNPHDWTPEELLAVGVSQPALFAPGSQFSYSNTNYIALGLILQKTTGHSLADLIQQRIVRPLGLHNTYLATPSSPVTKLADGYEPDAADIAPYLPPGVPAGTSFVGPARADYVDVTEINPSNLWGAGGIVSTADDWARFDSALMSGKLLPAAELREMRETVPEDPAQPDGDGYGLGLRKVVFPCGTVWGHDGQAPGYSSQTYTDITGTRTVEIVAPTIFGLAAPKTAAAYQSLTNAAVCAMLGRPIPAS
ncbi:Serine-type D-Ala-D-Ala carboxypeptidase [Catenulispora acidiphila DSM 44928]|uniref:Serine-type D-Ala-D-Ala carboxypeptidase n=1 Tax=Catenulispora acidiphila (strain DSM 44928 / JCM 14897 / NBRC 102108 / NRRL B-24433 / ID139908) TaxID=479433 RepID=C7Q954_CATAD|nr:serine hydrolase domain-containing protein [Catenulispora acidiphila]ACU72374.1 Serine-type D-Ala-D-Ala carboxypeptidase [Catenulispora acidiphila DSM 44928]